MLERIKIEAAVWKFMRPYVEGNDDSGCVIGGELNGSAEKPMVV